MTRIKVLLAFLLFVAVTVLFLGVQSPRSLTTLTIPLTHAQPLDVPTYAPLSASPILSVAFSPDTQCSLSGPCSISVEVTFASVQSTATSYSFKFFDRCSGTTITWPGHLFVSKGFTRVYFTSNDLHLPAAKSAALVAVTTLPAAAASAPLLLGATTCA